MMTAMLRGMLIAVSVVTMVMMVKKIRQAKVQIEDSIFWILLSFLLPLVIGAGGKQPHEQQQAEQQ